MTETNASAIPNGTTLDSLSFVGRIAGAWRNISGLLLEGITRRVEHKTGNFTLTAADSGKLITNLGAGGTITGTLPPATVGLHFQFLVRVASQLRVVANGSELLETCALPRVAATASDYLHASVIGASLHLVCLETGKWAVMRYEGTWTLVAV